MKFRTDRADPAYTVRIGVNYLTGATVPLRMTPLRYAAFHWRDQVAAQQTADVANSQRLGNSRAVVEIVISAPTRRCA